MSLELMIQKCRARKYGGVREFDADVAVLRDAATSYFEGAERTEAIAEWEVLDDFLGARIEAERGTIEKTDPSARRR
jgi:hypothetical protein